MRNYTLLILISLFIHSVSNGQISFSQASIDVFNLDVGSGAPMAISDMDGDGLDDIISLDQTRDLFISYQEMDNSFSTVDFPNLGTSNWGMTIGDVSNDGLCEVLTGGAYNEVRLIETSKGGASKIDFLDGPDIFVQALSFFDINNDGLLDASVCHDDGPVAVYMNNGAGVLSYDPSLPFTKFSDEETNSGNYGNIWTDVNGDGLMDYYIAKCRQAVTDMTDLRRVNQLWINKGDGTFTESAADFGLDIGFQSWTAEFQDIDNDGDMDCLITNHDGPSQLFENINNTTFIDITNQSGIDVQGQPVQATMKDFDNDGFIDAYITGIDGALFRNNGDKTFTKVEDIQSNLTGNENSFAIGDLNHDGFLDMMIGYGIGFNNPSGSNEDKLWLNTTNDNHWLAVQLKGSQSNRDGIGSRIEIYGDWGIMVREVRAGESYGTCHTKTQHFGIGTSAQIDSIVVRWPSGVIDSYDNIAVDEFLTVVENNCISPPSNIIAQGPTTICTGEDVILSAAPGFNYLWSNGQNTQSISVNTSGVYFVQITNGSDCVSTSNAIEVIVDPEESFMIEADRELIICEGETVVISSTNGDLVSWSNGSISNTLEVSVNATVFGFIEGTCGQISSNNITVEVLPAPPEPSNIEFDFEFDQVTLTADGEGVEWYSDVLGLDILSVGNELIIDDINGGLTVFVATNSGAPSAPQIVGESQHEGSSEYNSEAFNGGMIFDTADDILLRSVTIETDIPGLRTIQLLDANADVLNEVDINVPVGTYEATLSFRIPAGNNYQLTTKAEQNIETLGFQSPRLKRSAVDFGASLSYPYQIANLISIKDTNFGNTFYYYFYDWNVSIDSKECRSELIPVDIVPNAVFNILDNADIDVFPNPSSQFFEVRYAGSESFNIRVLSLNGREHLAVKDLNQAYRLDLNNYGSGVFIMEVEIGEDVFYTKLVKL